MDDLRPSEHRVLIEAIVAQYIQARIEFVPFEVLGTLARALWGSPTESPLIQVSEHIYGLQIEQSLLALAVRGHVTGYPQLAAHADEISSPLDYLRHLVLHEVAHIKNDWKQDRETDCDLWVYEQMH
jgi:hypothetical protein